jgi:hypothetical protein
VAGAGWCKGRDRPAWGGGGGRRPEPEESACHLPVDEGNSLDCPRSKPWESASPYDRFCHMITHLQQPAPSCSCSPPCTRRPCPDTAGGLMSAVVKPAGNLDRPSWSSCPADIWYRENGAGEGCIRIRTSSSESALSPFDSLLVSPLTSARGSAEGASRSVGELTSALYLMSVIRIVSSSSCWYFE